MDNTNSLAHTKWNCKYHIVFAPKYRRKVLYGEKKVEVGKILRQLCEWKGVKIIEAEVCPDHVHMLLEIPPKVAVSSFIGYLKGKSSLMLYEQFPALQLKIGTENFGVAAIMWTPQGRMRIKSLSTSRTN
jgi:putative transposase